MTVFSLLPNVVALQKFHLRQTKATAKDLRKEVLIHGQVKFLVCNKEKAQDSATAILECQNVKMTNEFLWLFLPHTPYLVLKATPGH